MAEVDSLDASAEILVDETDVAADDTGRAGVPEERLFHRHRHAASGELGGGGVAQVVKGVLAADPLLGRPKSVRFGSR